VNDGRGNIGGKAGRAHQLSVESLRGTELTSRHSSRDWMQSPDQRTRIRIHGE
jgi:hypothetical protein